MVHGVHLPRIMHTPDSEMSHASFPVLHLELWIVADPKPRPNPRKGKGELTRKFSEPCRGMGLILRGVPAPLGKEKLIGVGVTGTR